MPWRADAVNSLGLLLDIAGVVLLFIFGLPAKVSAETHEVDFWGSKTPKAQEEVQKYKRYKAGAYCGLALLIIGFSLQLLSNWL